MDKTNLPVGTICKIVNLQLNGALNGHYCETLKPIEEIAVPEADGVTRTAPRYGCEVITAPAYASQIGPVSGYFKPENLEPIPNATRRGIDLHLFGWTNDR